jgi:hypothetical protein
MRQLVRLGHCALAGGIAGAAVAPLQLLLWPDGQLTAGRAVLALLAWASWASFWGGLGYFVVAGAVEGTLWSRRARHAFRLGMWRYLAIANALLVAGLCVWNRAKTRDLLVSQNREALTFLGWAAGLVMVLLIVAAIRGWPRRRHLVLGSVAGVVVAGAAWWAWLVTPSAPVSGPAPDLVRFRTGGKLLFLSWEGTDLAWLVPAMERGDMPFLKERWERGAWGRLRPFRPFTRSATLSTLVTGCAPAVHGVLGRRSYRLPWLSVTPMTLMLSGPWPSPHHLPWRAWEPAAGPSPSRAPLWQVVQLSGLSAGVAGWPPYLSGGTWSVPLPLAAETIPYERLDSDVRAALDPALAAYPEIAAQSRAAIAVAQGLDVQILEKAASAKVDALVVSNNVASRLRPLWTIESGDTRAEEVLRLSARLFDLELQRLWTSLDDPEALLVVTSPYGLAPPGPWQRLADLVRQSERWRVSPEDSPDGFILIAGPGVKRGARLRGARLADVTPTVLYLLGLPTARDMAGRVLSDAIDETWAATHPVRLVPTFPGSAHAR